MDLDNDTWVVVADGEKYLLLRNRGDRTHLRLEVVDHADIPNAPAHELASDRTGRRYDAARNVSGQVKAWGRSAMEETDWHRLAEARFADELAGHNLPPSWPADRQGADAAVVLPSKKDAPEPACALVQVKLPLVAMLAHAGSPDPFQRSAWPPLLYWFRLCDPVSPCVRLRSGIVMLGFCSAASTV